MLSSSDASMRMRCTVVRDQGGADPFGGGTGWAPVAEDVRCLWWTRSGREQIDDNRTVVLADEHIMFPHGTDVQAGDRIVDLVDIAGREPFGPDGFREVEHVTFGRGHLDCSLRSSS